MIVRILKEHKQKCRRDNIMATITHIADSVNQGSGRVKNIRIAYMTTQASPTIYAIYDLRVTQGRCLLEKDKD